MSNDDHQSTGGQIPQPTVPQPTAQSPVPQPPQDARTASAANAHQGFSAPTVDAPAHPRRARKSLQVLGIIAALVASAAVGGISGTFVGAATAQRHRHHHDDPDPSPSPTASEASMDPTPIGYHGTATNTNELSPQWVSGLATAWTIPLDDDSRAPLLIAEGTTLYAVLEGTQDDADTSVTAYDISGNEPLTLWTTTGPHSPSAGAVRAPGPITTETQLLIGGIIVDKANGDQSLAPWGADLPIGVVDGNLVTCDTVATCTGWVLESGTWTQRWSAATSPQQASGVLFSEVSRPSNGVIGEGSTAAVIVPVRLAAFAPQIVDPRTGAVTTLGKDPTNDASQHPTLIPASDGLVVLRETSFSVYDTTGRFVETEQIIRYGARPTYDGHTPTLEELTDFLRDTSDQAPWTTASVYLEHDDLYYAGRAHDDKILHVHPTASANSRSVNMPDYFGSNHDKHDFEVSDLRVDSGATVAYVRLDEGYTMASYFVDLDGLTLYVANDLDRAENLVWAFDDLLVGVSNGQIVAFTPPEA